MKTVNIIKISINFLILICLALFFGCSGNDENVVASETFRTLTEEMETQIKQDYFDTFIQPNFLEAEIESVRIEKFYGVYGSGAIDIVRKVPDAGVAKVVVMMGSDYENHDDVESEFMINSTLFKFNTTNQILVWRKGKFHTIQEAYNQKMLDIYMIRSIASYHNGLSMETANQIKEAVFEEITEDAKVHEATMSELVKAIIKDGPNALDIHGYFGTYNGYTIVTVFEQAHDGGIGFSTIAGILFRAPTHIQAWKDGQFYHLVENTYNVLEYLYNNNLLTEDDIKEINYYHRHYYFSGEYDDYEQQNGGTK